MWDSCLALFRSDIILKAWLSIVLLLAVIEMFLTIDFELNEVCFSLLRVSWWDVTFFFDFRMDFLDCRSKSRWGRQSVSNSFSLHSMEDDTWSILGCFLWLSSFTWAMATELLSFFILSRYRWFLVCLGLRLFKEFSWNRTCFLEESLVVFLFIMQLGNIIITSYALLRFCVE